MKILIKNGLKASHFIKLSSLPSFYHFIPEFLYSDILKFYLWKIPLKCQLTSLQISKMASLKTSDLRRIFLKWEYAPINKTTSYATSSPHHIILTQKHRVSVCIYKCLILPIAFNGLMCSCNMFQAIPTSTLSVFCKKEWKRGNE